MSKTEIALLFLALFLFGLGIAVAGFLHVVGAVHGTTLMWVGLALMGMFGSVAVWYTFPPHTRKTTSPPKKPKIYRGSKASGA